MWFEILPAFGIITVALAVPGFAIYHIQNAWTGNVSINLINITLELLHNMNRRTTKIDISLKK